MITIGIPIYNAEKYLVDAIKSVLAQSYEHWELLLVDDGSTDHSLEIARNFEAQDSRIRVISDGINKKLPARLNQIIAEAEGEYIARMDADDLIHPDRLKVQLEFLNCNKEYDLVSTGVVSINIENQIKAIRTVEEIYTDFSEVKRHYPIVHASILAKRRWYERNQYDVNFPRSEDFELWCRAISNADLKLAVLPQPLYYYREEGLVTADKLRQSYIDGIKVYKKYKKNPDLRVIFGAKVRILSIELLDQIGCIQKLIDIRNRKTKPLDKNTIDYHEKIINSIINS